MDAKQMGEFIAIRRKELGMTQATLAQQLHVTDKAVSRWERGVGLPDINSLEALATALDISLIDLIRAQHTEAESISTQEAEQLLTDTIALSRPHSLFAKSIGTVILILFSAIALLLIYMLIDSWGTVLFSVTSLLTGLLAWGIPIWKLTLSRSGRTGLAALLSTGFALVSITVQFYGISNEVYTGDWATLLDTADVLSAVVLLFSAATLLLQILMLRPVGKADG